MFKEMPLISSHLYKYLSGGCLILYATEPYPSMPRPWCLEVPLYFIPWHQTRFFFSPLYKKKRGGGSLNVITSKEKMPLSVNGLRSVRINRLWDRIHLRYHFFQKRDPPCPPYPSQKCKYRVCIFSV